MNRRSRLLVSRSPKHPVSLLSLARQPLFALIAALLGAHTVARATEAPTPTEALQQIETKVDVDKLGAIALQHSWRYATVDSWARDTIKSIHGSKPLLGLDPVIAAMELMFNGPAHDQEPLIFIKDRALRSELVAHPVELSDEERSRIMRTGLVSRAFLRGPVVRQRLSELSADFLKKTAMDRLMTAINYYDRLGMTFTIVPHPQGEQDTPWYSLLEAAAPAPNPPAGLTSQQVERLQGLNREWQLAWQKRDVAGINTGIAALVEFLPTLSPAGVYPTEAARKTEVTYRRMGLMRWAWFCYIAAFFVSIFAVATGYGWVRAFGLVLLMAALGLHGYDIGLRWQVLGRIPVANMYEAVTSSTWMGAMFGLLLELFLRKRVFLLGSALLGFFALSLPEIIPDQVDNRLTTMMPILDDIMLRVHTVLIICSYAVITLAFGVANCYLFVAGLRDRSRPAQFTIGAQFGALAWLLLAKTDFLDAFSAPGFIVGMILATVTAAFGFTAFCAAILRPRPAIAGPDASLFPVRGGVLEEFDFSHRVLLYTASISLFVGLVLGAVWADYSWGRPWGWDPKEVFALNTWLVYAILLHVPFVTRQRALWTCVLSVIGFAVMQFNWWVVNFYIVGLHSYA